MHSPRMRSHRPASTGVVVPETELDADVVVGRLALADVTNDAGPACPGPAKGVKQRWNDKREGVALREVLAEVLLTPKSAQGRELPEALWTPEQRAWRASADRRVMTDDQWRLVVEKASKKGIRSHHLDRAFLQPWVRDGLTKLGVARKLGGGSGGRKKLTATTVNILESMCVDKGRVREEQAKRARTFNYECGKIETNALRPIEPTVRATVRV